MRIRLSVQRNGLPPVNVLWSVPTTNSSQAYTIARLLEDVNHIIPLEGNTWGLEDYTVEVGGFECLHFSPVAQALKEDDLVSIRPLLTAEVRGRSLSGRYQISDGGQHLVDGIPYGRPYLRTPNRPAITIPPRKRQRLLDGDTATGHQILRSAVPATADVGEPGQGGVNITIMNGSMNQAEAEEGLPALDTNNLIRTHKPPRSNKIVRFQQMVGEHMGESEEEEDEDENYVPDQEMEHISDDEPDVSPESSENSSIASGSDSDSDSDSNSNSDSDSSSESASGSSASEVDSSGGVMRLNGTVAPSHGKSTTRYRNQRRRRTGRLKKLKELGILPSDANFADLDDWDAQNQKSMDKRGDIAADQKASLKRKRDDREARTLEDDRGSLAEVERARQELLAKYDCAETGTDNSREPEPSTLTNGIASEATRKRLRPDVSAISRIIAHQARSLSKKPVTSSKPASAEGDKMPDNPDYWKSKVNVSAFECWFEDVELSAPPFPFKQHWDEASRDMRERQQALGNKKKNKRRKTQSEDLPDESVTSESALQSDYGNVKEVPASDTAETETVAIENQLLQDVQRAGQIDLPSLPSNVESLPSLSKDDIKMGALIVYKAWEMAPGTVFPTISGYKTAVVEQQDEDSSIGLRLASRDIQRVEKKYDAEGNRVYEKADAFQMQDSDEEGNDGLDWKDFSDLLEAKLMQSATQ